MSIEEKKTGYDNLIFCAKQEPSVATLNSATTSSKEPESPAVITMRNSFQKMLQRPKV